MYYALAHLHVMANMQSVNSELVHSLTHRGSCVANLEEFHSFLCSRYSATTH